MKFLALVDVLNDMFRHWDSYPNDEISVPYITPEWGTLIYAETERCEPFQYTKSSYDNDHKRSLFMVALFHKAMKTYPVAMERARIRYFSLQGFDALVKPA